MRLVATADTHGRKPEEIEDGDVFIHAGDFTRGGSYRDVLRATKWMRDLPHKHKILIPGNHDKICASGPGAVKQLMTEREITYLVGESTVIDDIKFYGFPWTPKFCNWYFMFEDNSTDMIDKCAQISDDTNVLISHGPPHMIRDRTFSKHNAGSQSLMNRIIELTVLRTHIFGHIHEGFGMAKNGVVRHYNVSYVDFHYNPSHPPVVIDI